MPPRTDEPVLPTPQLAGVFEGTNADEVIQVGDTDADGDTVSDAGSTIDAGGGNDTVYGGLGGDTIAGGTGNDAVFGGDSGDSLMGGDDNDTLWGDAGDDTLHGNAGDDKVIGGRGDDLMYGDEGDDEFVTDKGTDTAYGGSGDDIFRVYDDFGHHLIVGGETGETEGDTLDASALSVGVYMKYSGDGEGSFTDYGATVNFSEIEKTYLGAGNDRVEVVDSTSGYLNGGDSYDTLVLPNALPGETAPEVTITSEVPYDPVSGVTSKTGYVIFHDGSRLDFENFEEVNNVCICFTPGTLIDTARGRVAVEDLAVGDRVLTRDHGYQELAWTGRREMSMADLAASPDNIPVRIAASALGRALPERDMVVSPRHRMLVTGARAELMFGEREVLVAAGDLMGLPGVSRVTEGPVSYIHVMCEAHQIIRAEGAWTESFQPAEAVVKSLDAATRAELLGLFPELATPAGQAGFAAARPVLSGAEARTLFAA